MTLALLVALSLGQTDELPPPPPPPSSDVAPPLTPAPAPAPMPAPRGSAQDREVTIRALHEEITELEDQKGSIGYVFPIICIAAGIGLAALGLGYGFKEDLNWLKNTLIIGGTAIGVLSTFWLIFRIVKSISLGNDIDKKHDLLEKLEAQRLQVSFGVTPRGSPFGSVSFAF